MTTQEAADMARAMFGTKDATNVWNDARMVLFLNRAMRTVWRRIGQISQKMVLELLDIPLTPADLDPGKGINLSKMSGQTERRAMDTVTAVKWVPAGSQQGIPLNPSPWRNAADEMAVLGPVETWFCAEQEEFLAIFPVPFPNTSGSLKVLGQSYLTPITALSGTDHLFDGRLPQVHDLVVDETLLLMAQSAKERIQEFMALSQTNWDTFTMLLASQAAQGELISHGGSWE